MQTKRFSVRVVLTVTTGRLLTKRKGPRDNGISDLYELLDWMTGDSACTHQLPRFAKECKPWLLRWFPDLQRAEAELPQLDALLSEVDGERACELWLDAIVKYGILRTLDVPKIPPDDHDRKDPYDELVVMRGTDEGIITISAE